MATYTIVDEDKDPLDPGELNAGGTFQVSDGDIFVVHPSANSDVIFESSGGGTADFDIIFNAGNANDFKITVEENLIPSVQIADHANLANVDLDAKDTTGVEFSAGNNVSFGGFEGSTTGPDIIVIGDHFATTEDWKTGGGDDTILIGDSATFAAIETSDGEDTADFGSYAMIGDLDTGAGGDSVTFGNSLNAKDVKLGDGDDAAYFGNYATIEDLDAEAGSDSVTFGNSLNADDVKLGDGDDTLNTGSFAEANVFDGGDGNDTHNSQTAGTNSINFGPNTPVCFAKGMMVDTINGPVAVEKMVPGSLVETIDNGHQAVKWVRAFRLSREELEADLRRCPIRISAGALCPNIPSNELIVSRQHRILLRSPIVQRMFGHPEIFVPAIILTDLPGVDQLGPEEGVEYYHFLLSRHEVVRSQGVETESLFLGSQTLKTLDSHTFMEIEALGERDVPYNIESCLARPSPKDRAKLRRMIQRHVWNKKNLQVPRAKKQKPSAA